MRTAVEDSSANGFAKFYIEKAFGGTFCSTEQSGDVSWPVQCQQECRGSRGSS